MSDEKQANSPPTFADATGESWAVNLTLGLADKIQQETGVDLLTDAGDTAPILNLLFDGRKLGQVLWSSISAAATERKVSREDFLNRLNGDALAAGWGAVVDAIVFFTHPHRREAVRAAIEAQVEMIGQGALAVAQVAESPETSQAIQEQVLRIKTDLQSEVQRALARSVTNSEESAA